MLEISKIPQLLVIKIGNQITTKMSANCNESKLSNKPLQKALEVMAEYDGGNGGAGELPIQTESKKILRIEAVLSLTGLRRSTLYELIGRGEFPKPINLSARAVGWLESEIDAWIAERIKARDNK